MNRSRRKTPIVRWAHDLPQRAQGQEALASALANPRAYRAGQRVARSPERPSALAGMWRIVWTVGGLMAVTAATRDGQPSTLWVVLDLASDRRDAAGFRVMVPWPIDPSEGTEAAEMSTSSIEALASAWARIAEEVEFPADYEGTASPEAHRASEAIQERIREHIVATNDMRLFGLLHLLGQASRRMEQALWLKEYERMTHEVEEALREAGTLNAKSHTHEEVMQAMQERIDRVRDKPC